MFFKQQDLEFLEASTKKLCIGKEELEFSMCRSHHIQDYDDPISHIDVSIGDNKAVEFPKAQLISSNIKEMDQILVMNFFKILDNEQVKSSTKEKVYGALFELNDEELKKTLFDIGDKISDEMEFNFYGAFQINPKLIKEVSIYKNPQQ